MYMYMYYNQPSMSPPFDVTNYLRTFTFAFGKIVTGGSKMGAEHSICST